MITMYDAVDTAQIPAGAAAVAGYVNGQWVTYPELKARFPGAHILSIAVDADHDADALDIEQFDATPAQAAAWFERQRGRGVARPCLYASVSVMQSQVLPAVTAAGVPRSAVRLWSAHYGAGQHICGPSSCGELDVEADGTQWTSSALGRDLDESLLTADFFAAAPPVNWQEAMMRALPILKQGATGADVKTVQALSGARGHACKVDGVFGPATATAVAACQRSAGVTADSVVGPVTWTYLVTGGVS